MELEVKDPGIETRGIAQMTTRYLMVCIYPHTLTWGLTHDWPASHIPNLQRYLNERMSKTVFSVVGSMTLSFPALLQAVHMSKREIVAHAWSTPHSRQSLTRLLSRGWFDKEDYQGRVG